MNSLNENKSTHNISLAKSSGHCDMKLINSRFNFVEETL